MWEGTGLKDEEYFAHRNDSAPLVAAAQLGDIGAVRERLEAGDDITSAGLDGETALHMASALGFVDIVRLLLDNHAHPEVKDKDGATPLMHCARFCPAESAQPVADLLIAAGANTATTVQDADSYHTPLSLAIQFGNIPVARYLAPRTNLAAAKSYGRNEYLKTVLNLCRLGRDPEKGDELLNILIDAGLKVTESDVPLALRVGKWSVVERVLKAAGLDENWFRNKPTQLLADALEDPYLRDYPFADVARRFFDDYSADPNDPQVQYVVISRYDQKELLEVALQAGMDLTSMEEKELNAMCFPMLSKEWTQFVLEKRAQ